MRLGNNDVYTDFMRTVVNGGNGVPGVDNPYALAAIASTGMAESGFSPQNANRTWNDGVNNAGGIMSWNGPRLAALQKFAGGGNGTAQQQAQFFLQENPDLIQKLNGAKSVDEAQKLMNKAWAFKGYDQAGGETAHRLGLAHSFLKQFSNGDLPADAAGYTDPVVSAPNSSSAAVNAMANGTLQPNLVQSVQYVPPPGAGHGNFLPLFGSDAQPAQQATQQPQAVQSAPLPPVGQGNDVLKQWGLGDAANPAEPVTTQAQTPSAQPVQAQQPSSQDALAKAWGLDKTDAAPAEQAANAPAQAPANQSPAIGANDAIRSVATGVPVVGGLLNRADAATNALLAPVLNPLFAPADQLKGETFSERYNNSLAQQQGMDQSYAQQHPIANTVGNVVGGVAGTVPLIAAAPTLMGAGGGSLAGNMLMGGVSGAAIGGADSAIRSDGDLNAAKQGAIVGGLFGGAGPAVGKALGVAGNKLLNVASRTTPAARNVASVMDEIGMTPQRAQNILSRMGPDATIADIDPALSAEAGGLAAQGGAPTSILKNAMLTRAAGADDRVMQSVESSLGARPDLTQTQEAIAAKASADASPHYQAAGNEPLDPSSVVRSINDKLVNANGSEKAILTKIKGYFTDPAAGDLSAQVQKAASDGLNPITDYMAQSGSTDSGLDKARQILVGAQNGTIDQGTARQALSQLQTSDPQAQKLISGATDSLDSVTSLKTDPEALLKVRQAIDDDIQNAPKSDTTGGKNAVRAATDVRNQIDQVLKVNPGIKAGDQAYATQMQNMRAVEEGQEIFTKGTKIEDWRRSIAQKTPEQVQNMQTGALSSVWDAMDEGRNGDWSAVRSLLGKSTANRQRLEALFPNSTNVFDTIANEAAMRATEQTVARNSETALRQAIQAKYGPQSLGPSGTTEAVVGNALAGGPGAVAGYLGRNALNSLRTQIAEGSRNALMEGTAKGLSATGPEQQQFINQLMRAHQTAGLSNSLSRGADIGSNLLFRAASDEVRRRLLQQQNAASQ